MKTNRHHYLPQFYIKGFVNSTNKVFVYDKFENKFKNKELSPKQIFFEWNRNTLFIDGEEDDFVEELYGNFETRISPAYNKIKDQSGRIKYDATDVFNLLLLVSLTHWRLPLNDKSAEDMLKSTANSDLYFKIFNKESGKEANEEFYDRVKNRAGFVEMYKLSKPISEFMSLDLKSSIDNWKVYSAASEIQLHLLGDNPIILKNKPGKNILENEMIFPLTKGITLYHNKHKQIHQIQPKDRVNVDIMIFLQSERYVVGPNKDYLNAVKNLANGYDTKERIETLRREIFKVFE